MSALPTPIKPDLGLKDAYGNGSGTYHIQRLLPRHFQILELHLGGLSNVEIASTVGMTKEGISTIIRSPIFQSELQRRLTERNNRSVDSQISEVVSQARKVLEHAATKAAETQEQLLESDDDSVKLRASDSILDRVLGRKEAPGSKSDGPNITVNIASADVKLLLTALTESKEFDHAEQAEQATNRTSAGATQDGQVNVHQASDGSPR